MAVVEGTNCGFLTTAPTTDPGNPDSRTIKQVCNGAKFTAPANGTITEVGYWQEAGQVIGPPNMDLGVFSDDGTGLSPDEQLDSTGIISRPNFNNYWCSGAVSVPITSGTVYWIAVNVGNTLQPITIGLDNSQNTYSYVEKNQNPPLPDPWGSSDFDGVGLCCIYAKYTPTPATTTTPKKKTAGWFALEPMRKKLGVPLRRKVFMSDMVDGVRKAGKGRGYKTANAGGRL